MISLSNYNCKQTIVRFVSRRIVNNVYKYKKNLKEMVKCMADNVYITDDLTQLHLLKL